MKMKAVPSYTNGKIEMVVQQSKSDIGLSYEIVHKLEINLDNCQATSSSIVINGLPTPAIGNEGDENKNSYWGQFDSMSSYENIDDIFHEQLGPTLPVVGYQKPLKHNLLMDFNLDGDQSCKLLSVEYNTAIDVGSSFPTHKPCVSSLENYTQLSPSSPTMFHFREDEYFNLDDYINCEEQDAAKEDDYTITPNDINDMLLDFFNIPSKEVCS